MKKQLRIAIASLCLFAAPLVASSVSPNFTTTTVQAMNMYQDPTGFADLHWGETLEAVQQTHTGTFVFRGTAPDPAGWIAAGRSCLPPTRLHCAGSCRKIGHASFPAA